MTQADINATMKEKGQAAAMADGKGAAVMVERVAVMKKRSNFETLVKFGTDACEFILSPLLFMIPYPLKAPRCSLSPTSPTQNNRTDISSPSRSRTHLPPLPSSRPMHRPHPLHPHPFCPCHFLAPPLSRCYLHERHRRPISPTTRTSSPGTVSRSRSPDHHRRLRSPLQAGPGPPVL